MYNQNGVTVSEAKIYYVTNVLHNTSHLTYCPSQDFYCHRLVLTGARRQLQKRTGWPWAAGSSPGHSRRSRARLQRRSSGSAGRAWQGTRWRSSHTHSQNELFLPRINMRKHKVTEVSSDHWALAEDRFRSKFVTSCCWQSLSASPASVQLWTTDDTSGDFCLKIIPRCNWQNVLVANLKLRGWSSVLLSLGSEHNWNWLGDLGKFNWHKKMKLWKTHFSH